nr:multidrug effflux MFS transporter [uncultured Microbacterium sp.]
MTLTPTAVTRRSLPSLLLMLTVFGPISMDLYLPALPALTLDLRATTSISQLTITSALIGLALGQLIAGLLSDRHGRRRILIIGIAAYVATSALCALSPTVEVLIAARLVQGLAGGVGIVIANAAGRDVYSGSQLIRFYARLTVAGGLAAIIGPLLGGFLSSFTDWRGLFLFLALAGVAILLAVLVLFDETLPSVRRSAGGLRPMVRDFATLLADRAFLGAVLSQGFAYAALFAYLSGATFVLQDIYGLSPQWYAAAFGLNSAGFMLFGHLAGGAAERWSASATLGVGVVVTFLGALGLLAAGIVTLPLWFVVIALFTLAGGVAITSPPATSIALSGYPHMAGTASSLLGMARFGFGGIAAPLVGIAGSLTILPLGLVTTTAAVLAALAVVMTARSR